MNSTGMIEEFLDGLALMMADEDAWAQFVRVLDVRRKKIEAGEGEAARYHEVKEGDTLEKLAHQYYGDSEEWPKIYDANGVTIFEKQKGVDNHCRGPEWVVIGTKLRIP